jgi:hypothetical protein
VETSYTAGEAPLENIMAFQMAKKGLPYYPVIPFLDTCPREQKSTQKL